MGISITSRPSSSGWLLALVSLVLGLLVVLAIAWTGAEIYHELLVRRVTSLIDSGKYSQAESELSTYFEPPWFLRFSTPRLSSVSARAHDDNLALLQSAAAVYRNEINVALTRIPEAQNEKFAQFRKMLSELDSARDELQRIRSELSRLRSWLENFPKQYDAIAKNFGELLSLAPLPYESDAQQAPIYNSGVLQGLPQLENLDDGLPDFPALAAALKEANGAVTLEAADQHQAFVDKLEALRSELSGALTERDDTAKRIAELESTERSDTEKRIRFERALKAETHAFVNDSLRTLWGLF